MGLYFCLCCAGGIAGWVYNRAVCGGDGVPEDGADGEERLRVREGEDGHGGGARRRRRRGAPEGLLCDVADGAGDVAGGARRRRTEGRRRQRRQGRLEAHSVVRRARGQGRSPAAPPSSPGKSREYSPSHSSLSFCCMRTCVLLSLSSFFVFTRTCGWFSSLLWSGFSVVGEIFGSVRSFENQSCLNKYLPIIKLISYKSHK